MTDHSLMKLGKLRPRHDGRVPRLARYVAAFPPAPPSCDYSGKLSTIGMMGNDRLGDCLIGETLTVAPGLIKAYRVPYDGPVVTIITGTGKKLTSTCNHAVLTTRGFVPAYLLQEGDYVLGSDLPQTVARGMGYDFEDVPAPIKDVFEARERVALPFGIKRKVCAPVDFHGDARFFKSKVDIIDVDSLLEDREPASFSEPESKQSLIFAVGASKSFYADRALSTHSPRIGRAAPRRLSGQRIGALLLERQLVRTKLTGFGNRPHLYASPSQKTAEGLPMDPELPGEFLRRFPGEVTPDRIVKVEYGRFSGHVYDLSTIPRWYIANGIIAHNCTCAAVGHAFQVWTSQASSEATIPDSAIVALYERFGYNPANAASDQGAVETDVLTSILKDPVAPDSTIDAYAAVDVANLAEVRSAVALFGLAYIGIDLPTSAQSQDVWDLPAGQAPSGAFEPGSWGGHAVIVVAYDDAGLTIVTWGALKRMTWAFWEAYVDEAYAILSPSWKGAEGFDYSALADDMKALTTGEGPARNFTLTDAQLWMIQDAVSSKVDEADEDGGVVASLNADAVEKEWQGLLDFLNLPRTA